METFINPQKTALVAIDLQKGIVGMPTAPHASSDVVTQVSRLADACRLKGMPVILVRVTPSTDGKDRLSPNVDTPMTFSGRAADWAELVAELNAQQSDIIITKRQWGAFYGTELDLQLRRRGIDTIILCGISTNIGVESTARDAYERGYTQLFAEDAMSARSAEEHLHAIQTIFPRMGCIRSTEEIINAIQKNAAG